MAALGSDALRLFAGLWCMADRDGRLEDRPQRIEAEIFPFKFQKIDIENLLRGLASGPDPFIIRYEAAGRRYIQVVKARDHFHPHPNEKDSEIPKCFAKLLPKVEALGKSNRALGLNPDVLNPESPLLDTAKPPNANKRFVKPTPEEVTAYAKSIAFNLDGKNFVDHYAARGWQYKQGQPMKDWQAAVRTWKKNDFAKGATHANHHRPGDHLGVETPPGKYADLSK